MYQNKLQEQGLRDIVNINKIQFESYSGLVDLTFLKFKGTLINNQDPHRQIEKDETPKAVNLAFFKSLFNLSNFNLRHFLFMYIYFNIYIYIYIVYIYLYVYI